MFPLAVRFIKQTQKSRRMWIYTWHGFVAPAITTISIAPCTYNMQAGRKSHTAPSRLILLLDPSLWGRVPNTRIVVPMAFVSMWSELELELIVLLVLAGRRENSTLNGSSGCGARWTRVLVVWIGSLDLTRVVLIPSMMVIPVVAVFVVSRASLFKIEARFRNWGC